MRLSALLVLVASAFAMIWAGPARAGKNDDAWAACLWEKVPTSANSMLSLPVPPKWQGPGAITPEYALQHRLHAACYAALTPAGKKNPPSFNMNNVRKSLLATKPAAIAADTIEPRAYVCQRYFLNDTEMKNPAGYRWGFGEDTSKAQFGSMSLVFAAQGGGGVGLPDVGGLEKCQFIRSDGSLSDA